MYKKITLTEEQLNELAELESESRMIKALINKRIGELKKLTKNEEPMGEIQGGLDMLICSMRQYQFFLAGYSNLRREELGITEEFN